jgi:hypothetical protein
MAKMKHNRALAAACAMIVISLCLPAAAAENAFKLRNADSGLYLSVTGAVRQDGANMIQWRDVGQPDAVWTFERRGGKGVRIRNAVSGKYVTVTGDGNAIQWRDAGQPGLIWVREKTKTADCYKLRNRSSGLYLAADEGAPAKGRNVIQRADAGQPGLTWCREAIEDPDSTTAAASTIKLKNDYSRMYLAVQDGSSRDGGNVIQTGHAGRPGIVWVLERHDAKTVRIRNANSGRYLAVAGDSTAPGGNVIQSADTGRPGLIWERETAETGNCYKFRNHNSGMYLAVDDGSQAEGANVIQWGDVGHRLDIEWCREK